MQPDGPNPALRRSEYEAAVAVMTQLIASLRGSHVSTATSAARSTTAAAATAATAVRDARQYTSSQQCSSDDQLTRQWSDVSDYASVAELSAVRAPKSVRATQPFSHRAHATSSSSTDKLHDGCGGSVVTGTAAAVVAQFCASDATAVRKGHTRAVIEGSSIAG
jgi:hypothetical protein